MKKVKAAGGPLPVYANECVLWLHDEAVAIEFKLKMGDSEERVALVLMHPNKYQEMLEVLTGVEAGLNTATKKGKENPYKGVEFG